MKKVHRREAPSAENDVAVEDVDTVLKELTVRPVLFEILEVSSGRLIERFLEFVSRSMLLRARDGTKPGAVIHCVMPSIRLSLTHYVDTDFLHLLEGDAPQLLCLPLSVPTEVLRTKMEEAFKLKFTSNPQMMASVRLDLATIGALWSYVNSRKRKKVEVHQDSEVDTAAPMSRTTMASERSTLHFFANDFVLMFEQKQPLVVLHAALDRLLAASQTYSIDQRVSLAIPVADCLVSLTDVLSKSSEPSIVDGICDCGLILIKKLRLAEVQGVCDKHADALLTHCLAVLRLHSSKTLSTFVVSLLSIVPPAKITRRATSFDEQSRSWIGNTQLLSTLCECAHQCFRSFLPEIDELGVTLEEFQSLLLQSGKDGTPMTVTEKAAFPRPKEGEEADLEMLWVGGIAAIEATTSLLDTVVQCCDSETSTLKTMGRRLLRWLTLVTRDCTRCLWIFTPERAFKMLCQGAASICSYFRRVPFWCAMLDDSDCWVEIIHASTALLLGKAAVQKEEKAHHLHFIHHQWIVKLCVGCGAASLRSILSELHFFYCLTKGSSWADAQSGVWGEVHLVISAVCAAAPSPSQVQTIFQSVSDAVEAYATIQSSPSDVTSRQYLTKLMFTSIVDLSSSEFVRGVHVPDADRFLSNARWEGYEGFPERGQGNVGFSDLPTSAVVSTLEFRLVSASLVYIVDVLRVELRDKRLRSYSKDCIAFADALDSVGAPHSVSSLLVSSGMVAAMEIGDVGAVEKNMSVRYPFSLWHLCSFPDSFQRPVDITTSLSPTEDQTADVTISRKRLALDSIARAYSTR